MSCTPKIDQISDFLFLSSYDNANENNDDGTLESFDTSGEYPEIDMQYILSRDEFQPCPGKITEWSTWSNCDRSCDNGIRIRTRGCFDVNGNQLGLGY